MPLFETPDGRYLHAITTANEGDGNDVVYDKWVVPGQLTPVWDKFSYEAGLRARGVIVHPPGSQPQPSSEEIESVTPLSRQPKLVRITTDGNVPPRMYSYWSNACVLGDYVFIFCGNSSSSLAQFFKVHPDDTVERLPDYIGDVYSETEGWYWRRDGWLYLFGVGSDTLHCRNPFTGEGQSVLRLDGRYAGGSIWQPHSSDDGRVHCATVKDSSWNKVAVAISVDGNMSYVPAFGQLDESHVSGDGRYVIIEEDDNTRIVDVASGRERLILDADGALAHLDCGTDFMVGEDNQIGACVKQDLSSLQRIVLFNTWGMGHVSVRNNRCLLSRNAPENDLCWVGLSGEGITPIIHHRMVGNDYDHQVKANLDYTASVAVFMSNMGGSKQDVYLIRF